MATNIRKICLLSNDKISTAIQTLLKELEGEFFKNGLKECSKCQRGFKQMEAINIHCQLKSVYDVLLQIHDKMVSLKSKN